MHHIDVNGLIVDVVRKDIKNLHIGVYPPTGRIRVAAPLRINDEAVRLAVISRLSWIKRQKLKFEEQERQTKREYVSGESHYFFGARYLLNVVYHDNPGKAIVRNKKIIDLFVRTDSNIDRRERVMLAWYRAHLRQAIPQLIEKWEKIVGVDVADWGIKKMKTRWGSCTIEAGRIWLNLELAKKPPHCLEFIVVHEMVHLLEPHHNERFVDYMNKFLPQWRQYREELNRAPLAHAEWDY
jgi:hypothetical protein